MFYALLAHLYDLSLRLAASREFQALLAALAVCGAFRLASRRFSRFAIGAATVTGWLVLTWPGPLALVPTPFARLPLAGAFLFAATAWQRSAAKPPASKARKKPAKAPPPAPYPWYFWLLLSLALAWWLRGLPIHGGGIVNCVPVTLGLVTAFWWGRRAARSVSALAGVAGALALAVALFGAHAAPHLIWAATVPAIAGMFMLGIEGAAAALPGYVVTVAAAALLASDEGRFIPADAACAAPFLTWMLARRMQRRLGAPVAAWLAGALGAGAIWIGLSLGLIG